MSDRETAIKEVQKNQGTILVRFPEIIDPYWEHLEEVWLLVRPDDPIYQFWKEDAESFDRAGFEDISKCIHCGSSVVVFEEVCPNCGSTPYLLEDET